MTVGAAMTLIEERPETRMGGDRGRSALDADDWEELKQGMMRIVKKPTPILA